MQNILLLIDTNPKLTKIALSILAKLTIINVSFGTFSESCFATLLDLMNASKELEKDVMKTIKTEVIKTLKDRKMEDIPISLLNGLANLISKSKQAAMLSDFFSDKFFHNHLSAMLKEYQKNS